MSPNGPKAIEEFVEGDPITSRNEFEPGGELEVKRVEKVFRRTAHILHLHVGGKVIRTTGEHPFFAYDKGWVKAAALVAGDRLLCADGQWVAIEDILDTGEWEVVYNLRIADYHTYFVTDWDWGFSVWSHNLYIALGMTTHLIAFRNAVCPGALIYSEWNPPTITATSFQGKFHEAIGKADSIYVNRQGVSDVAAAIANGAQGPYPSPPIAGQGDNIFNWELNQLSAYGALYSGKIRWYDGTNPQSAPAGF